MKRKTIATLNGLCILASLQAFAYCDCTEKNMYFTSQLGYGKTKAQLAKKEMESVKTKINNNLTISASIGYIINEDWRVALSASYMPTTKIDYNIIAGKNLIVSQPKISSFSSTIDLTYDLRRLSYNNFTPYVMAGLGAAYNTISDEYIYDDTNHEVVQLDCKNSTSNLVWKLGTGVTYDFSDSAFLNLGYQFTSLGKVGSKRTYVPSSNEYLSGRNQVGNDFKNLYSHQLVVGFSYKF